MSEQDQQGPQEPTQQEPMPQQEAEQAAPQPQPTQAAETANEGTWALFCHLSALSLFIGVPFGNILGPLIIWLIKKDTMPLVDDQGKEALNFQISMTIYGIVSAILCLVVIGFFLLAVVGILSIVFVIIAAVSASKGEAYRYPLTIRFLK